MLFRSLIALAIVGVAAADSSASFYTDSGCAGTAIAAATSTCTQMALIDNVQGNGYYYATATCDGTNVAVNVYKSADCSGDAFSATLQPTSCTQLFGSFYTTAECAAPVASP